MREWGSFLFLCAQFKIAGWSTSSLGTSSIEESARISDRTNADQSFVARARL